MVRLYDEWVSVQKLMKFLYLNTIARAPFSKWSSSFRFRLVIWGCTQLYGGPQGIPLSVKKNDKYLK